jgi:hypothetical protein
MGCADLKTWHAEWMLHGLKPVLGYLARLEQRLTECGYPRNDHFYRVVLKAHDAMHHLCVELHRMSVRTGVGDETKE